MGETATFKFYLNAVTVVFDLQDVFLVFRCAEYFFKAGFLFKSPLIFTSDGIIVCERVTEKGYSSKTGR